MTEAQSRSEGRKHELWAKREAAAFISFTSASLSRVTTAMTCPDALPFLDLEDSDFAPLESKRPPRPSRRVRRTFTSQFIVGLPSAISEWIPMEVIEVMLNYLGDLPNCNATLASCSLVCKAWHSISRYLLFRNVTVVVGQTNIDLSIPPSYDRNHFRIEWPQLSNIVLSRPSNFNPSFSATRYIQKICWTGGSFPFLLVDISEDIHDFFSIAKDFTSLRSIALFYKVYHAEAATTQAQLTATLKHLDFRSMMDNISNLEINDCDFRCTAQVYILVAALRRLERLVIYSTGRRDPAPAKPSDLSAPPTLHALGFWYCNFTIDALRWITSTPNCYITNLSVGRTSRTSEVSECLALMGGSLLRLCVGTKGVS